ncbi:hypothetical protein AB0I72_15300 [Nocardiopsis sp. NPDC049922]|uniref:hypothetical protein n=1 Tax=Nocardiopsis sp. NPDC049922 TaxID=3155157 RepID=UPI0033CFA11D
MPRPSLLAAPDLALAARSDADTAASEGAGAEDRAASDGTHAGHRRCGPLPYRDVADACAARHLTW